MKIMLGEAPIDLKLFSAVLDSSGHRLLGINSAEQAVEVIKERHPK
jgi:hypothetical protein